jgi:hypothetical protein
VTITVIWCALIMLFSVLKSRFHYSAIRDCGYSDTELSYWC